jgi:hypothetical protein
MRITSAISSLVALLLIGLTLPTHALANSCPWHCKTWFDGCGNCTCVNGKVTECDKGPCRGTPNQRSRCIDPSHAAATRAQDCRWFGTAPFCNGSCPVGYHQKITSNRGDGKKCRRGSKVYCCRIIRGQSPASCLAYATHAIQQLERARERGCAVQGAEWNPNFDAHFDWCLRLSDMQSAVNGNNLRDQVLAQCQGRP